MPTLTTDTTNIYYEDEGPRDAPALVFSHSLFFGHWMFEAQATAFASRYRVIRYDHRGQGRSARHPREELDMDTLADDAAALIERLELGPCMFFGISMGGFVALRLAARRPELLSSVVVAGSSGDREQRIDEFDPLVAQLSEGGVSPVLDVVSHIMFGDTTLSDPARAGLLDKARERLTDVGPDIGDPAWQVVHRRSVVDELPSITVPTLVLAGAEDHVYDAGLSRQIADLVPNARLKVVEGVGHSLALEDPSAINSLLADLLETRAIQKPLAVSSAASPLQLQVVVSPAVDVSIGGTFSPTTATIITGPTEAVLVDTLYTPDDVERLARAIEATGKTLTTIYITHAHFDHYFGLGRLLERFPDARGVALPAVANMVRETHDAGRALADYWLPGKTVDASVLPKALDGETIALDGHELHAIEVGQGDIAHSTILHVPSIDAVVAGDVVYNGVHQMLGISGPDDWSRWIDSVDKIAALNPQVVVAGHKQADLPDDDILAIIDGTRSYITAFIEEVADAADAQALIARMTERFPDRINLATLEFSAAAAIEQKQHAAAPDTAT